MDESTIVDTLAADIERRLMAGNVPDRVLAMDVLTHALEFARADDALHAWRSALHGRKLAPQSRSALRTLIRHLVDEHAKGNDDAAASVCNCLAFITSAADSLSAR